MRACLRVHSFVALCVSHVATVIAWRLSVSCCLQCYFEWLITGLEMGKSTLSYGWRTADAEFAETRRCASICTEMCGPSADNMSHVGEGRQNILSLSLSLRFSLSEQIRRRRQSGIVNEILLVPNNSKKSSSYPTRDNVTIFWVTTWYFSNQHACTCISANTAHQISSTRTPSH